MWSSCATSHKLALSSYKYITLCPFNSFLSIPTLFHDWLVFLLLRLLPHCIVLRSPSLGNVVNETADEQHWKLVKLVNLFQSPNFVLGTQKCVWRKERPYFVSKQRSLFPQQCFHAAKLGNICLRTMSPCFICNKFWSKFQPAFFRKNITKATNWISIPSTC